MTIREPETGVAGVFALEVLGSLTQQDSGQLAASFEGIVAKGGKRVVVDLRLVRRVGRAELGVLITATKKFRARDGGVVRIVASLRSQQTIDECHLDKLFGWPHSDFETAVRGLRPADPSPVLYAGPGEEQL